MTIRLNIAIGFSVRAWFKFIRLILFVVLLLPNFLKATLWYFTSNLVSTHIYGKLRRQNLDIYDYTISPKSENNNSIEIKKKPVIIFISGGAWIIGYKAWSALISYYYCKLGFIVVCPDYRNFPQCDVVGMLDDLNLSIDWVVNNISRYNGDPNRMILMGQSAGAHLISLIFISAIVRSRKEKTEKLFPIQNIQWTFKNIRGVVGISGAYDLVSLAPLLELKGLNISLIKSLFHVNFQEFSPLHVIRSLKQYKDLKLPVTFLLLHGTNDCTVPHQQSENLKKAILETFGPDSPVKLQLMKGLSHTDAIIEFPFSNNHPLLDYCNDTLEDMINSVDFPDQFRIRKLSLDDTLTNLVPIPVIHFARYLNPF